MLILCGCGEKDTMPTPAADTVEKSENSFGARYSFTLTEIDKELTEALNSLGAEYDQAKWEMLSNGLIDNNGVAYLSYTKTQKGITYAAAVENDSKKVMNIGCGCPSERLENVLYRERFLKLNAAIAGCAGGYEKSDRVYIEKIFDKLLTDHEDTLYYEGMLYIRSIDKGTTLLMTAPCSKMVVRKNEYREYTNN